MSFKKDFLWGGAVAAHQLEGAYDVDGKGLSIMDLATAGTAQKPRRKRSMVQLSIRTKILPAMGTIRTEDTVITTMSRTTCPGLVCEKEEGLWTYPKAMSFSSLTCSPPGSMSSAAEPSAT